MKNLDRLPDERGRNKGGMLSGQEAILSLDREFEELIKNLPPEEKKSLTNSVHELKLQTWQAEGMSGIEKTAEIVMRMEEINRRLRLKAKNSIQ